ncbi:hypothetical protein I5I01_gp92 [Mycobacterium phage MooMoo]|uniref:Uncharacterized protein n=1 Tax=Mycobacterium phage MooMoo TaxID=2108127 RepID=A0A2P1JRC7_9CAUD|nr:hypothetical protein I5I01_gp92 [Mycobacterium phage MooMoo]AVO21697.1 hypothetical protein SEA_MOOMOO_92 [Mycobacterium phage MooMoo]
MTRPLPDSNQPRSYAVTNQPVADLISANLPHLVHPGDDKGPIPLPLPMFRNSAIPRDMADEMAKEAGLPTFDIAKLTAEAIVALLESNGWSITRTDELAQLKTDAAAGVERHRRVEVQCACGVALFEVDIDADRPKVNGGAFIKAIGHLDPDCTTKHGRDA